MKRTSVVLAGLLVCGPAFATDNSALGRGGDWSGFYAGFNAGYASSKNRTESEYVTIIQRENFEYYAFYDVAVATRRMQGAIYGGHIGYNFQRDKWIFGVEADLQGASLGDKRSLNLVPHFFSYHVSIPWIATARLRAGVVNGSALIYVTGGIAAVRERFRASTFAVTGVDWDGTNFIPIYGTVSGARSGTRTEWTAGVGIEGRMRGNWSWRAEYLHIAGGSRSSPMDGLVLRTGPINIFRVGLTRRVSTH